MAQIVNIGTDELVRFTNRLEKMRKSDLPVVVRQTLNKAAVDMRNKTLPVAYKKAFIQRDKNFLKSRARFSLAKGLDIKAMKSSVGILPDNKPATTGLAKQETGGMLSRKSFIPTDQARTGGSKSKKIARRSRLSNIAGLKKVRKNDKRGFMREAKRVGRGGHVLYGNTLFEIKNPKRQKITAKPIYSFRKGRSVGVKPRPFIRPAALVQGSKLNMNFQKLANIRIKK